MAPKAEFVLNSDTVSTPALVHLAKTARWFVVATGKASHAATSAIDKARTKRQDVLYPDGKGTSSILRCVARIAEQVVTEIG